MGLQPGIIITSVKQPESGGIIATYCPICKRTEIFLNGWAKKPDDGDFFYMSQVCINTFHHDLQLNPLCVKGIPWPLETYNL